MRTLLRILSLLLLLLPAGAWAQGSIYFNNRYPIAVTYSAANSLLPNGRGVVVAGGGGHVPGQVAPAELALMFVDSAGGLQATRFYEHRAGNVLLPGIGNALLRTPDGGMALVSNTPDATGQLISILWRFNAQGDTLWTHTYTHPPWWLGLRAISQYPNGDFVMVGSFQPDSADNEDLIIIRTDSLGNERWRRSVDLFDREQLSNVTATPDGGCLATGVTVVARNSQTPDDVDGVILKLDATGAVQWQHRRGGPYFDAEGPAVCTPDGGYLVAGRRTARVVALRYSAPRISVTKYAAGGTVEWEQLYGPSEQATYPTALRPVPGGSGYVVAGVVGSTDSLGQIGRHDGFALSVCADGDSVWYRTYQMVTGPRSANYVYDLVAMPDGSLVGAGFFHPFPPDTGTMDVWLFKTDPYGYVQAGGAPPARQCVLGLPEAAGGEAVQVWPNPAPDGRFTVQAGGGPEARVAFTVCDALGRRVTAGALRGAETMVDLSRHPPGLYLLRLTWPDGRTITKKLLR